MVFEALALAVGPVLTADVGALVPLDPEPLQAVQDGPLVLGAAAVAGGVPHPPHQGPPGAAPHPRRPPPPVHAFEGRRRRDKACAGAVYPPKRQWRTAIPSPGCFWI